VKVLSIAQIAARLDNCFKLLGTGSRTVLPRHQTLRATIDWSYDLLPVDERTLLCRLSVFAGGFTLEAAEEICAYEKITTEDVLSLLSHLVDKSLVVVTQPVEDSQRRYRLLETVRQYTNEKLLEAEGTPSIRNRHAGFFLNLAEEAEPHINTSERSNWLARLDRERDNLRAALGYTIEFGETQRALRLIGSLTWYWFHSGYWSEGRGWITQTLSLPEATERTALRAKSLFGEGLLAWTMGDRRTARAQLEESADICRELGDRPGLAHTLHFLAVELLAHGELKLARSLGEESVAMFRELNHDLFGLSMSCASLGIVAMTQEDYRAARPLFEESIAITRLSADNWAMALPLRNLGIMAFRNGDYDAAVELLKESLAVLRDLNERWFVSRSIESLAAAYALKGECDRAARLLGAGEALREAVGASVLPFYRADYDRAIASLNQRLNKQALAKAWAEGKAMTMRQAISFALSDSSHSFSNHTSEV
jgi:non-specific serine/threonine protein kinase